jgi:hypothetical protein
MKARTSILVICLAAISVSIGWAQTVPDRDGKQWSCRDTDGLIYTKSGTTDHIYDIAAARTHGEAHAPHNPHSDHLPICIDALNGDRIAWYWPGANRVKVSFVSETTNPRCQNSIPFTGASSDSGVYDFLPSGKALDQYSGCVYDVIFKSNLGKYDPHIIIKGSYTATLQQLQEGVKDLEALEKELKADEEKLEKQKK